MIVKELIEMLKNFTEEYPEVEDYKILTESDGYISTPSSISKGYDFDGQGVLILSR